jgi:hypothetical protein
METTDPVAALKSKSISDRAAGCRDLSLVGTVDHLDALAGLAGGDRSPGVRLSAAAAAADILSRCRIGEGKDALNDDQRDVYLATFSRIDPVLNGGVFPMLAVLDRPRSLQMIQGGLRDPRADVRLAAAVGLMRLCSSVGVAEDKELEETVVGLLADTRHQPDAVAQICRVCAAVGYASAADIIRQVQLSGTHQEMVIESLGTLDGALHPLRGVWFSDGRDAGETNPNSPAGPAQMVFDDKGALMHDGKRWTAISAFSPLRRMFLRRSGEEEARPAFQASGRTFYAGPDTGFHHADWSVPGRDTKAAARAVAALQTMVQVDSAADQLALAHIAMDAGQAGAARAALEAAIAAKKTPVSCWLNLADLLWGEGDKKAAKSHYVSYAKKGKRKDNEAGMDRAKERS